MLPWFHHPARMLSVAVFAALEWRASGAEFPATLPPLSNAQQVLELGTEKARKGSCAVEITGVVTFPVPGTSWAFVQDQTAGILVIYTNSTLQPSCGDGVRVTGQAGAGLLAPIIMRATLEPLGPTALPQARRLPAARLAAGEYFGQWVELGGAVRDVARDGSRLIV